MKRADYKDNNIQAFFELLRAGLWEKEARLSQYNEIDYAAIMRLAEEQSVVGVITAGLERVVDVKVPKEDLLQFVGSSLQIEQQNKAMNAFVAKLIDQLRGADVYSLLLKGQGIAQCYEKPLWRAPGDVDLFLSEDNYEKARALLTPLASTVEEEDTYIKHIGMMIGSWEVELHGNLRGGFSARADKMLDEVKDDTFYGGSVRSWLNGNTQVFLLSAENDVVYVFTHILHHFFRGGIGLRQICDWCRLLWTYRKSLNRKHLESRIRKAGLMSEWKAFAALAVDYLGMPVEAMPFYDDSKKWHSKANRIIDRVLKTGNFGHNIDESYRLNDSFWARKAGAIKHYTSESFSNFLIFPIDSIRSFAITMKSGVMSTLGLK